MAQTQTQIQLMSEDEYFELDDNSPDVRYEFFNGASIAKKGEAPVHVTIAAQTSFALNNRLDNTTCQAGQNDLKVGSEQSKTYCFPDVLVWCENARWDEKRKNVLISPIVIIEVLSPSTQRIDKGAKLNAYLQIPELLDYLIVSSDRIFIEHYARLNEDDWRFRRYHAREPTIEFAALDLRIPVAQIYHKSELPEGVLQLDLPFDDAPSDED